VAEYSGATAPESHRLPYSRKLRQAYGQARAIVNETPGGRIWWPYARGGPLRPFRVGAKRAAANICVRRLFKKGTQHLRAPSFQNSTQCSFEIFPKKASLEFNNSNFENVHFA
jgi:hypothetical protein